MFFIGILTEYILPVVYDSFVALVLVLFFLFIFRIKDSNIRILFFFLPLVKPFLIIAERVDINKLYLQTGMFAGGIRFPDPNNIIKPIGGIETGSMILGSGANFLILIVIVSAIFVILLLRWLMLARFYRRLAFEEKVDRKDVPEIYDSIDKYVLKTDIRSPDVSLTHRKHFSAFVVGVRNRTMVLSPNLFQKLEASEQQVLIHHELSHIKRHDNLVGWIAMVFRDLLFFNPFAYIAYFLIRSEQEKDSDKLMVKYSGIPVKEIAKNIVNTIAKIMEIPVSRFKIKPIQNFNILAPPAISYWRLKNRVRSILKTDPSRLYSRIFPRILMVILFVILLLLQIIFMIRIDELIIFLR